MSKSREYTKKELELICKKPERITDEMLAKLLDRSVSTIRVKRHRMLNERNREERNRQRKENYAGGRTRDVNTRRRWGSNDTRLVLQKPESVTDRQLAQLLGRSVQAVQFKRWISNKTVKE